MRNSTHLQIPSWREMRRRVDHVIDLEASSPTERPSPSRYDQSERSFSDAAYLALLEQLAAGEEGEETLYSSSSSKAEDTAKPSLSAGTPRRTHASLQSSRSSPKVFPMFRGRGGSGKRGATPRNRDSGKSSHSHLSGSGKRQRESNTPLIGVDEVTGHPHASLGDRWVDVRHPVARAKNVLRSGRISSIEQVTELTPLRGFEVFKVSRAEIRSHKEPTTAPRRSARKRARTASPNAALRPHRFSAEVDIANCLDRVELEASLKEAMSQQHPVEQSVVLGVVGESFSTLCPLSQAPIVTPVRSTRCVHIQCFCLESLKLLPRKYDRTLGSVLKCPSCGCEMDGKLLYGCAFTKSILDELRTRLPESDLSRGVNVDVSASYEWSLSAGSGNEFLQDDARAKRRVPYVIDLTKDKVDIVCVKDEPLS